MSCHVTVSSVQKVAAMGFSENANEGTLCKSFVLLKISILILSNKEKRFQRFFYKTLPNVQMVSRPLKHFHYFKQGKNVYKEFYKTLPNRPRLVLAVEDQESHLIEAQDDPKNQTLSC